MISVNGAIAYRWIDDGDHEPAGGLRRPGTVRYNVPVSDARTNLLVGKDQDAHVGATVLRISGELDLATISILKDAVGAELDAGAGPVVLDLSDLTFCDSTGLGSFVAMHRHATEVGSAIALAAPRRRVADLLQISGINQVVRVFDSVTDAVS
jgi:anti-sigma B factor antagonist